MLLGYVCGRVYDHVYISIHTWSTSWSMCSRQWVDTRSMPQLKLNQQSFDSWSIAKCQLTQLYWMTPGQLGVNRGVHWTLIKGWLRSNLREWIDTQLQMALVHIIQSFNTYRSVNLSADTYRGGIGKEVWEMYIVPLPPDCYTRLHFEPKALHYFTPIPSSFTCKHTWIYQWMGYRPIL